MITFKKGGVHPDPSKLTSERPIQRMELPRQVVLMMSQHIGAPAVACVKKGDHVERGQKVGEAPSFVSANVHTPITGTVAKIEKVKNPSGYQSEAVVITASDEDHDADMAAIARESSASISLSEALALDPKKIVEKIGEAGVVGLGGATFPTRVKLSPPPGSKAEVLLINGAECEPYLTNDDRLMREHPVEIAEGIKLLMRAVGVDKAIVGIEENKPQAIQAMQRATYNDKNIEIAILKAKYPQGSEKQLIQALIHREVPSGALPVAVGAIVQNVATAYAVQRAVRYGEPLMERVVTVTGPDVKRSGNYLVALGTSLADVIALAGGMPQDTGKVILGGPMMGRAASVIETPTTKGVSGVLMLPESESHRAQVQPCIRCARCVSVCPMGLEPYLIATLSRLERYEDAAAEKLMDCVECGSCSYTCPSYRPILDYIRLGKVKIRANYE